MTGGGPLHPAGSTSADAGPADGYSDRSSADGVDSSDWQEPGSETDLTDWAWVEEWRAGREPVPWGPGLGIAGFTLLLVATAVFVLASGLADRPLLAIIVNVAVAAGLCPALWLSRALPVLRWIAGGAAAGVVVAWLCVLIFLL